MESTPTLLTRDSRRVRFIVHPVWLISALICSANFAQAPPQAPPQFEVASIKPDTGEDAGTMMEFPVGRFHVVNITPRALIEYAYNLKDFQVSGGPGWINSARYDIDAKLDDADSQLTQKLSPEQITDQLRRRVQTLLADRFQLKVTRTTREGQVYALVTAKSGVRMQAAEAPGGGSAGDVHSSTTIGAGRISGRAVPVASLASMLSDQLGRPVEDHTGLTGKFTFSLRWAPDLNQEGAPSAGPASPSGPSLFTAVQEQLGLKLQATKGQIETIVVDRIERPTEN